MRVLILGGTSEASALARLIAGDARFAPILSLAGRTRSPIRQPLPMRVGGFGGAAGLEAWLRREQIAAVVDATHPYAVRISANAVAACGRLSLPLVSIVRPPWTRQAGDRWSEVEGPHAAAIALGEAPKRVFLALGGLELAAFANAPQHHYVARLIGPPGEGSLPCNLRFIFARGPFDKELETALLAREAFEVVVSKNSGGQATYAKIIAARRLALPVVMIARPFKPTGAPVSSPEAALRWLMDRLAQLPSPSRRGV